MVLGFGGQKGTLGLDIGSSSIKLAELKLTKKGYRLVNLGEAFLPEDAIVNKIIVDPDTVIEAIMGLMSDLNLKSRNVAISISGNSINIKKVSMPVMDDKELREAIPWEIEQYIPQSIDDVHYDYEILPGENAEGNIDVLIVAAKRDIADTYVDIVTEAGLNPVIFDVDVFALENMYELNYIGLEDDTFSESDEVLALTNIGASVTNVNILKGGVSIFTRDITTGGAQLTEMVRNEFKVDYGEAERIKYTIGTGDSDPNLDRIARNFTETVTAEIKRTVDFFSKTLWKDSISKIVLSGGSSKVPYFPETLEESIGSPVEMANPFRVIEFSEKDFDPEYITDIAPKMGVVIGLALRRLDEK